jgi:transcriptional regulator GlxA family with amidase domain
MMKRRDFLKIAGASGMAAASSAFLLLGDDSQSVKASVFNSNGPSTGTPAGNSAATSPTPAAALKVPSNGSIKVAFAISENSNVIDMAGPWEVFQDAGGPNGASFELFTVAGSTDAVRATAGLHLIPDYSFDNAPQANVIVVPAIQGSERLWAWLRKNHGKADVIMSVCTGAFQLARAGLLRGKNATTHHDFWDDFAVQFPDVNLQRGMRFVENGDVATAGGLTSGFDMALRVVERYFGRDSALRTARYMEYESSLWRD